MASSEDQVAYGTVGGVRHYLEENERAFGARVKDSPTG